MNNFTLALIDTDSISITKPDMSSFSDQERKDLIQSLNSQFDGGIEFTDDGYFPVFIALKSKNYIQYDGKKITKKGSSLKSANLEPMLKNFLNEIIDALVFDKQDQLSNIYEKYVAMIDNIIDITPWCKKLTISETTLTSPRKNEKDIVECIKGKGYKPGDRIYVVTQVKIVPTGEFYKRTGIPKTKRVKYLVLKEDYKGDGYDKQTYYEKLFKCCDRFSTILPTKDLFKKGIDKDKE